MTEPEVPEETTDVKVVSPSIPVPKFDEVAEAVEPGDVMRAPDGHLMVKPAREVVTEGSEDAPDDAAIADTHVPQNPDDSQDIRFIPDEALIEAEAEAAEVRQQIAEDEAEEVDEDADATATAATTTDTGESPDDTDDDTGDDLDQFRNV